MAGNIGAAIGLKVTSTGDTLCGAKEAPILLRGLTVPDPVYFCSIFPASTKDVHYFNTWHKYVHTHTLSLCVCVCVCVCETYVWWVIHNRFCFCFKRRNLSKKRSIFFNWKTQVSNGSLTGNTLPFFLITSKQPRLIISGIRHKSETGQTVISGMGELHLEIIMDKLLNHYKVNATVGKLYIAYKYACWFDLIWVFILLVFISIFVVLIYSYFLFYSRSTLSSEIEDTFVANLNVGGKNENVILTFKLTPRERGSGNSFQVSYIMHIYTQIQINRIYVFFFRSNQN
jgi:hypothetical protein